MNPAAPTLLFVYGTLKRGGANRRQLAGQNFVGPAQTAPGFRLYDLGDYPGMIAEPDDRNGVAGELWSVDPACLARLDIFEGIAEGLYRRETIPLRPPFDEQLVETYLYIPPTAGHPAIESGNWPV